MTVDTLSIARELKAAEVPAAQAEAIAAAIGRSVLEGTATKADLQQTQSMFKADLLQLESRLDDRIDAKIERLRATLMMWFIGTNLTLAAIIIAAVKL